jgi:hypothetical protein
MKETKRPEKKPPGRYFSRAGDTEFLQNTLKRLKTETEQAARFDELSAIWSSPAEIRDAVFVHRTLCQIGFPRDDPKEHRYERRYLTTHLLIESGSLFMGAKGWVEQCVPFGAYARIIMSILTAKAVRNRNPVVDIGRSASEFLSRELDKAVGGSQYNLMLRQIQALAVCKISFGESNPGTGPKTHSKLLFKTFEWPKEEDKRLQWPRLMEFTAEQYQDLIAGAAVPLDHRHVFWLAKNGGCLAIDIYCWLAQRLRRINEPGGIPIGWEALKEQFGQEYRNLDDFRKEFKRALGQVALVYREAKIERHRYGVRLFQSKPPIPEELITAVA